MTLGSWFKDAWGLLDKPKSYNQDNISKLKIEFFKDLASSMYSVSPMFICHRLCDDGPLTHYPSWSDSTLVNVIHDVDMDYYPEFCFIAGVTNIVFSYSVGLCEFSRTLPDIPRQMIDRMSELSSNSSIPDFDFCNTKIRFIVRRAVDYDPDTETDAERLQTRQDMQDLNDAFEADFNEISSGDGLLGWENFKAVWIEDYPACPACEPEKYEKMKHLISI
jgi:hypothetical protein